MGLIMDFEGRSIDTLDQLMVVVSALVLSNDIERGHALRDAYRASCPDEADVTLAYSVSRLFPNFPKRAADVLGLGADTPDEQPPLPASLGEAIQSGISHAQAHADRTRVDVEYDTVTGAAKPRFYSDLGGFQ